MLRYKILGMNHGNFHPKVQDLASLTGLIGKSLGNLLPDSISVIHALRVNFTTEVIQLINGQRPSWFVRPSSIADGGVIDFNRQAIAVFNGDCPLVCLHDENRLCVLHGGYRCLMRENPKEEGIVEFALRYCFEAEKVKALVFGGIGPCCWAPKAENCPEMIYHSSIRHPDVLGQSMSMTGGESPFGRGRMSIDLYGLAQGLLLKLGVPQQNIILDRRCTCCFQENGESFWSHTRFCAKQQNTDGRNFSLAWLE